MDYNKPKRAVCNGGYRHMELTKENFNFRLKKNISKVKFTFEMSKWQSEEKRETLINIS